MPINSLISRETICIDDTSHSKTAVFIKLSQLFHNVMPDICAEDLFTKFWQRESLGSTTIGHGILLPHVRVDNINKSVGAFLKLKHPVDFGAEDKEPIDIVFALLVDTINPKAHLDTLAKIVRYLRDTNFQKQMRLSRNELELYLRLINYKLPKDANIEALA